MRRDEAEAVEVRATAAFAEVGSSSSARAVFSPEAGEWRVRYHGPWADAWRAREVAKVLTPVCLACSQAAWKTTGNVIQQDRDDCAATWWLVLDCGRPR